MREVRAKYACDYQTYKQFVSAVDSVPAMFFEEGSTCGLEETDFLDYGHLSGTGCGKFTDFFAEWLRRSQPQLLVGISKN